MAMCKIEGLLLLEIRNIISEANYGEEVSSRAKAKLDVHVVRDVERGLAADVGFAAVNDVPMVLWNGCDPAAEGHHLGMRCNCWQLGTLQ